MNELNGSEIAVIGMALRFPGADSPEQFWENLKNGVESVRVFTDAELLAARVDPARLSDPAFVKAWPAIDGIELFDADLFGIPPHEARLIDPQQRLFLECSWEALERAGYDTETFPGLAGVYAGCDLNSYLFQLLATPGLLQGAGTLQVEVATDKDYLASRVSYKLDLRGPSVAVQSACSTSLVAVHLACQGLLSGECDLALAGGSSVRVPQTGGYFAREGGIQSPDGHCRPFDARARGTVFGSGVGVVVLKRLSDALDHGDLIRAVIKGSAVNNDGARKVGYTAPGGDGQARVVRSAQLVAEVDPETITYVEAHGTATQLGDPIEVSALTQAFRASTESRGFCALGSVKGNIGHLKSAAGVAGLIKTALCLEHRMLPPTLHFERPNPHIDFAGSPFEVNLRLREWAPADGAPLRAAVSSFGVGGTNAHAIVEEAPPAAPSGPSRTWQLLPLSANTPTALDRIRTGLAERLGSRPELPLADVAWTLQTGRRAGRHRAFVLARSCEEAVAALESPERVQSGSPELRGRPAAFLFPGQGAQHPGMAQDLYESEPAFREALDHCCEILRPLLGLDLRTVIHPRPGEAGEAARRLEQTALAQPALFAVEHSLARLWMGWGVRPQAMLGHSLGEYVAACLAGVFSLEDALALVAERGRLMQSLPPGAMLSVPLPESELLPLLPPGLALAAVNGPSRCVVSGPEDEVAALEAGLSAQGTTGRRLHTSHAFHSAMMEPILAPFAERVRAVRREPPRIPFVSNLTGTWITAGQATDPEYWSRHLRQTVRFGDGLGTLAGDGKAALLEVGPGQTLSALARQVPGPWRPVSSLPQSRDARSAAEHLTEAVGRLWLAGAAVDWPGYHAGESRRRVELPTYPFERKRYWVEPGTPAPAAAGPAGRRELQDWFQVPAWKPSVPPAVPAVASGRWLVFAGGTGLGETLARRIAGRGGEVSLVEAGDAFEARDDYAELFARLRGQGGLPGRVLDLRGVGGTAEGFEEGGFRSLLGLAQELGRQGLSPVELRVVTDGLQSVAGEPVLAPGKATLLGPVRVLPLEHPEIGCAAVDVVVPADEAGRERLADLLLAEAAGPADGRVVAYRGEERWTESFEPVRLPAADPDRLPFCERGVYLITGGLGGVGLTLARELARSFSARLALTGRTLGEGSLAAVQELEELGAEVLVMAADVTDEPAMREVVRRVRERFGPIVGAIHAAGVPGGGVIQLKTAEAASRVLAPKVRGAQVLARVLADEPLELLVLLASTFGITGGVGQVDYCAANSFLDAFARQASQRGLRAVSLDWAAWQEIGMAAAAAAHRAAGEPRPSRSLPGTDAVAPAGPGGAAPLHPLLDRRLESAVEAEAVYATDLSPERHWVLAEHRILGTPALPGTAWLEMARAAFELETGAPEAELRDVTFVRPLLVAEGDRRETRIVLEWDGEGEAAFHGISRASTGGEWQEHAHGRIRPIEAERPSPQDPAALAARCSAREVALEGGSAEPVRAGRLVSWGPRWQSLQRAALGDNEAFLELELPPELAADLDGLALHPALLDVATAYGGGALTGGNALPHSYRRLAVLGPLPSRVLVHVRTTGVLPEAELITVDLTLLDEQGGVRVEVEGFSMKRMGEKRSEGAAPAAERASWIRPDEGVEAFRRALSRGRFAQIAISPTALGVPIAPVQPEREEIPGRPAGEAFPRPSLTTAYVAPRDAAEEALAELWQRVLKIDRIGIHDNFFDLGGDSVVAIQLVAQAAASGLVLTTQELFEKQTIAALSAAGQAEPVPEVPTPEIPTPETEEVLASAELSDADLSPESLDRLFARLKDLA